MADKDYTLGFCRYYKGEKKCPFELDKAMIWNAERIWFEEQMQRHVSNAADSIIEEYIDSGLTGFALDDGVPLFLKAILFNSFGKYQSGNKIQAVEDFKIWYKANY